MRRLVLMLFCVFVGLFITVLPTSADLTSNLIVGGDFISGSFTQVSGPISLTSGIWYKSSDAWTRSSNAAMAWAEPGQPVRSGFLVQTVDAPTVYEGPVELYFNYSTGEQGYA